MMVKDNRNVRPLLLKFGAALALSFAGFLYSHLRTGRIRSTHSPSLSPRSSDDRKIDDGGKLMGLKSELRAIKMMPSSVVVASIIAENFEEGSHHQKFTTDNPVYRLSPSSKHSGDEEGFLLPEFNDFVVKECEFPANNTGISPMKNVENPKAFKGATDKDEKDEDIINSTKLVRVLRERESNLEIQLLEYFGLKEQETAVLEFQNQLQINTMQAKFFTLKMESLQADNRRLEAQVADYSRVRAELESARAKIKLLKRKIKSYGEQNNEQLSALQQKVIILQDPEQRLTRNNADVQKKLQRLKELEDKSAELRRDNSRLQLENSELVRRLESTQILAAAVSEVREAEALQEANHQLKHENDNLANEIERLQANRYADVEELVYLRWMNACLRYELRNYNALPGKTVAKDLSKTLSPRSEEKTKQLILEYANSEEMGDKGVSLMDFDAEYWSYPQASNLTEGELDDSSLDNSSAMRTNSWTKTKFFRKLKNLVLRKDNHHSNHISSPDRTPTNHAASGRRESVSAGSFDDLMGTYSCDTPSSHNNSSIPTTGSEDRTDERRNKITTPSQNSSRNSLDIQRPRKRRLEDIGDVKSHRTNGDVGSLYGYKRMVLREGSVIGLPQDIRIDRELNACEKLELMKFADVLKG